MNSLIRVSRRAVRGSVGTYARAGRRRYSHAHFSCAEFLFSVAQARRSFFTLASPGCRAERRRASTYVAPRRSVSQDSRERRRQPPGAGTSHNICICSEPVGARPRPTPLVPPPFDRVQGRGKADGRSWFLAVGFGRATSHRISIARTSLRNTILKCCVLLDSISQARQRLARGTLKAESGDIRSEPRFIRGGDGVAPHPATGRACSTEGLALGSTGSFSLISMSMYSPGRIHTHTAQQPHSRDGARRVPCACCAARARCSHSRVTRCTKHA